MILRTNYLLFFTAGLIYSKTIIDFSSSIYIFLYPVRSIISSFWFARTKNSHLYNLTFSDNSIDNLNFLYSLSIYISSFSLERRIRQAWIL